MDHIELYAAHLQALKNRGDELLARENLELIAIHSGQIKRQFLDDMEYPFKVNPQFKAWCPLVDAPHCWLLIRADKTKPILVFHANDDFWHQQPSIDSAFWLTHFQVELIATPADIEKHLPYDKKRSAYLGEHIEVAQALGFEEVNPEPVLSYLHYYRVFKSPYEQACLRSATKLAIAGHRAARIAYRNGASEFGCLMAYVNETQQLPDQAPYGHIIAQNEHAAVLHYTSYSRQELPDQLRRSFLIDAGASFLGYASDISRTYAQQEGEFSGLIEAVDQLTRQLVAMAEPGITFAALHEQAHRGLAKILIDYELVQGLTAEQTVQQQITGVFMPHGIGHMLGLQVHDVGGNLADERGTIVPPPEGFPTLKTTRLIEPNMVFTIEPGIYFIDPLLQRLANSPSGRHVNWQQVDEFREYGGIRIEDNVIIHRNKNENLTRELGL